MKTVAFVCICPCIFYTAPNFSLVVGYMARATYKSKIRKSISYLIDYVKFMVYVISFLSPV